MTLSKITKIYIVEDHPIFRKGLVQLINNEANFEVCGESEESIDAINKIKKIKPDFVIVDISLKDSSGIELIKDIRLHFPDINILVLSMHDEKIYAERVLREGAKGYMMKQEAPEIVIKAINHILDGKIYVSEEMASALMAKAVDGKKVGEENITDILSNRELQVFQMIGRGNSTREIASKLNVSIKTIENHRAHIKEKLDLKNSIELLQKATLWIKTNE